MITEAKELGKALKEDRDVIEIEGDLAKRTIRIKATGKIAWALAIAAIGIAVASFLATPATGGASAPAGVVAASAAAGTLGGSAATTAIAIAVAAGGVGALNKLRSYKMEKLGPDHIILRKK